MGRRFFILLAALFAIKTIFLLLDPVPSFYFGDSGAYLTTAVGKWIPPNHSFVYGLLLRSLAVWPRSLEPVIVFQAGLSALTSWAVALCLVRYGGASFLVGATAAILCSIEPLQLLAERYILPETISVFLFAMMLLSMFNYLRSESLSLLVFIQILGVLLISFELNYLPVVLVDAVLLPLLSRRAVKFWKRLWRAARTNWRGVRWFHGLRFIVLPLCISVLFSEALLLAYKNIHGSLLQKPPAYVYEDGFSMAGVLAPIIEPVDYPIAQKRKAVFASVRYVLDDPRNRPAQRWMQGGLCDRIQHSAGNDELEGNRLAKETAVHAALRDPMGVVKLAAFTFGQYFHRSVLGNSLKLDEGEYVHPLPRETQMLKTVFGIDVEQRTYSSLTKRWHRACIFWYWLVMSMPFLFAVWFAVEWRTTNSFRLICLVISFILLAEAVIMVDSPNTHYLDALAWLTFITTGSIADKIRRRVLQRNKTSRTEAVSSCAGTL